MLRLSLSRVAVPLMLAALTVGCFGGVDTPDLGYVTGTITMDGKPLPQATVMFDKVKKEGEMGGRPAMGLTDAEGRYELIYSRNETGCSLGDHNVRITNWRQDSEDGVITETHAEEVPAIYNVKTELVRTVEPGDNTFDFDLKTTDDSGKKLEVIQPAG